MTQDVQAELKRIDDEYQRIALHFGDVQFRLEEILAQKQDLQNKRNELIRQRTELTKPVVIAPETEAK